ncbi:TPA: hypothetical protein ACOTG0_003270 [Clostridium perfringens]|nr:hypothetical protein [Clostridium perfringens]
MLRREKACIKEFYLNNRRGLVDIDGCIYLDGRYAGILKPSGIIYIEGKRGFIKRNGEIYLDGILIGTLSNYNIVY